MKSSTMNYFSKQFASFAFSARLAKAKAASPFAVALLSVTAGLLFTPYAKADSTWSGTTSANWNVNTNWGGVGGVVPGNTSSGTSPSTDTATFNTAIAGGFNPIVIDTAGQTIKSITFGASSGAYTVGSTSGNTLYLSSGGTIKTLTGTPVVENVAAPLSLIGSTAAYTFTSDSSTAAATLRFTGAISSGTPSGVATLTLNGANAVAYSGTSLASGSVITGAISNGATGATVGLIKSGTGSWVLSGSNSFSGGTTVQGGTLLLNSVNALGGANAGTFVIGGATAMGLDTATGSALTLTATTGGQTWAGNFSFTGTNSLTFNTGTINLTANTTVTTSAATLTEAGGVAGGFKLTKAGSGSLTLNGINTYSGGTLVSAGTLNLNGNNTNSGGITVQGGALTLNGTNVNQGAFVMSGGTLNLNNASALGTGGTLTITGGTLNNTSGGLITMAGTNSEFWNGNFRFTGTNALSIGTQTVTLGVSTVTVTVDGTGPLTVASSIGDGGAGNALLKTGFGTMILSGDNSSGYSGGTTVNRGVLEFLTSDNNIAGVVNPTFGGTAAFGYAFDQTTLGRIAPDAAGTVALAFDNGNNLDFSGGGLENISLGASLGAFTYSGSLTPAGTTYRLGGGGGTLILNQALADVSGTPYNLIVGGSGSGGAVTLASAGTYTGGTLVTGAVGSGGAMGVTFGGTILQSSLTGTTTPFGSTTGGITLNNGALGLGTAAALGSTDVMNVSGYNITYSGQDAIYLKAGTGGTSNITFTAASLTRSNHGVLLLNPTSAATLGAAVGSGPSERVFVTGGVNQAFVTPNIIDQTSLNFLSYDTTNGYKDITGQVSTFTGATAATNIAIAANVASSITWGGNLTINSLKLTAPSNNITQTLGATTDVLNIASGGMLLGALAGSNGQTIGGATINFGLNEGFIGAFGTGSNGPSIGNVLIGSGGITFYGNQPITFSNVQTTGGITIAGGTLLNNNNSGIVNNNVYNVLTIDKAGTMGWSANGRAAQFQALQGDGRVTYDVVTNLTNTGAGDLTLDGQGSTASYTFGGTITDGGTTSYEVMLWKTGLTTQILTGTNNYIGPTGLTGGTLQLDFSAAGAPTSNIINNSTNSSALTIGLGSTFDVKGTSTNSQRLNGLTLNAGNNTISVTSTDGSTVPTLTISTLFSRNAGATANFGDTIGRDIIFDSSISNVTNFNNIFAITSQNLAFATVNGTDWAHSFSGKVQALTFGGFFNYDNNDFSAATKNTNVTTSTNLGASFGINTLRFNVANTTLGLSAGSNTIGMGGLLVTPTATGTVINGGSGITLAGGNGELILIDNGSLTINAVIANNVSATALTLSGSGTTTLNAANTYTGATYLNSGTVVVGNNAAFNTGALNLNGGTLQAGVSGVSLANAIALNNFAAIGGSNAITFTGLLTNAGRGNNILTVNNSALTTLTTVALGAATYSNGGAAGIQAPVAPNALTIAGSGNVTVTGIVSGSNLTYAGTGTLTLGSAASTYSGITKISSGTISIGSISNTNVAGTLGTVTSNVATNLVLDGGTLKYTGAAGSTDRLFTLGANGGTIDSSGSGALTFAATGVIGLNNAPGTRKLTLTGSNTNANTMALTLTDAYSLYATSLAKTGAGTWVLTNAANSYTGGTTISGGILQSNVAGALGSTSGTLAINGGGKLDINNVAQTVGAVTLGTVSTSTGSTIQSTGGTKTLTTSGVTVNGTNNTIASSVSVSGAVTQNASSGLIVNGTVGADSLANAATLSGTGTVGVLTLAGNNSLSSSGALTTGGMTVSGAGNTISSGTVSGAIIQNTGSALAINGTATGSDTLNGSALLTGTGTVGALTLNSGATISPGTTTGTLSSSAGLTWNGGGTLAFNLSTTSNATTKLALTGSLTKGTGSVFNINLSGGMFTNGTTYELVDFGSLSGFSVTDFTQTGLSGLTGNFILTGSQLDFTVLVVPEPSTWAMMIGGLALLFVIQGKRRRS